MFLHRWVAAASLFGASVALLEGGDLTTRSTAGDILSDIENTFTCGACEVRLSCKSSKSVDDVIVH